jgi:hypothetical protein
MIRTAGTQAIVSRIGTHDVQAPLNGLMAVIRRRWEAFPAVMLPA